MTVAKVTEELLWPEGPEVVPCTTDEEEVLLGEGIAELLVVP